MAMYDMGGGGQWALDAVRAYLEAKKRKKEEELFAAETEKAQAAAELAQRNNREVDRLGGMHQAMMDSRGTRFGSQSAPPEQLQQPGQSVLGSMNPFHGPDPRLEEDYDSALAHFRATAGGSYTPMGTDQVGGSRAARYADSIDPVARLKIQKDHDKALALQEAKEKGLAERQEKDLDANKDYRKASTELKQSQTRLSKMEENGDFTLESGTSMLNVLQRAMNDLTTQAMDPMSRLSPLELENVKESLAHSRLQYQTFSNALFSKFQGLGAAYGKVPTGLEEDGFGGRRINPDGTLGDVFINLDRFLLPGGAAKVNVLDPQVAKDQIPLVETMVNLLGSYDIDKDPKMAGKDDTEKAEKKAEVFAKYESASMLLNALIGRSSALREKKKTSRGTR